MLDSSTSLSVPRSRLMVATTVGYCFFRANRQQIINLEFIRSVDLGIAGRLHVQLDDGREIQISRRQTRQFRERTTV
jgi:DNA-binding LytR/AlgR family response regulator